MIMEFDTFNISDKSDLSEWVILSERVYKKKHHVAYNTVLGMENAFNRQGVRIEEFSRLRCRINSILKWKFKIRNVKVYTFNKKIYKDNIYIYI